MSTVTTTSAQPSTTACQCGRILPNSNLTVAGEESTSISNMNHADYAVKDDEQIEGVAVDDMLSAVETDSLKNQVS